MNMPLNMVDRSTVGGWASYEYDPPLTEMGLLGGQMVGRGMENCKVSIKTIYSSPSLRCVQTANSVLKAYNNKDIRICVEPGLFEWMAW